MTSAGSRHDPFQAGVTSEHTERFPRYQIEYDITPEFKVLKIKGCIHLALSKKRYPLDNAAVSSSASCLKNGLKGVAESSAEQECDTTSAIMSPDAASNNSFDKATLRRRETLACSSGILGLVKDAHVFRLTLLASIG